MGKSGYKENALVPYFTFFFNLNFMMALTFFILTKKTSEENINLPKKRRKRMDYFHRLTFA